MGFSTFPYDFILGPGHVLCDLVLKERFVPAVGDCFHS